MEEFVVLLLVPLAFQHLSVRRQGIDYEKRNTRALLFFFVLLAVLIMFRHESVGTDTSTYVYFFDRFSKMSWDDIRQDDIEIGFSYFNKIVSLFSKDPQFFLAVVAIVIVAMIYPTYKRLCTDASLTIVLFCILSTFLMLFSGIRQMLAIGIGFLAYECTRSKKIIPFILLVCLATAFHSSAFMLAFMYPLYHARITRKWLIAVVPALAVVFVFNKPIFTFLAEVIEKYTKYDGEISSTGAYTMLILFAVFAVFSFVIPNESLMDSETIGLRNILLLSVALQMFAPLHSIAMRMNYYYIIFIPLLLPKIIAVSNVRWRKVAVYSRHIMVVFFLLYFFYSSSASSNNLNVFPYHFFWENVL